MYIRTERLRSYPIIPVAKPRQTAADKWKKRPAVLRYRAFADEVRLRGVEVPEAGAEVVFVMPMSKSWSKKKKAAMDGMPHQNLGDLDNLLKSLLDAVYADDKAVWMIAMTKIWGGEGRIIIGESSDNLLKSIRENLPATWL